MKNDLGQDTDACYHSWACASALHLLHSLDLLMQSPDLDHPGWDKLLEDVMEPYHTHESKDMAVDHIHVGGYYHAHYHEEKYGTPIWFCGCSLPADGGAPRPIDECPIQVDL